MPRLAVLGYPVSHSRSPAMHTAALVELGLAPEWTYEAIEVAPQDVGALIASLPGQGFAGVNVTLPHKLAALAASDVASVSAKAIGAANTLTFRAGRVEAENTDPDGVVDALPADPKGMRALVMGAGGSARAAIWALREAGAQVRVWNRTAARAVDLAREFAVEAVGPGPGEGDPASPEVDAGDFDLVLNATTVGLEQANSPAGSEGSTPGRARVAALKDLPIEADSLLARHLVVDLVYGDTETGLVSAARAAGASCVDGLDVLVCQGAASLSLWTGRTAPVETMRRAARGAQ